jgi:glycosyltransferase involved in cell wall biosynthesis
MNNQIDNFDIKLDLTILMPCLNESETLVSCINKAQSWLKSSHLKGEILIADNGSIDGSQKLAISQGARVINVDEKGYGSALFYGIQASYGEWIIMGDSDDSYNFSDLDLFIKKFKENYDLVIGNRFSGKIFKDAMPWKNKYIGNPILTQIGNLFFNCKIKDFHCGLRGITKKAFYKLNLVTTGMEFASEMIIKASLYKMKITEVPVTLSKDGRSRPPHLRPWRDGWRHLRFMLLLCPRYLFLIPGALISIFSFFILEIGILIGVFLLILGVVFFIKNLLIWKKFNFGMLEHDIILRSVSLSTLLIMLGAIIFSFSLIINFILLPTKRNNKN